MVVSLTACVVEPLRENIAVGTPSRWTSDAFISDPVTDHWLQALGDEKLQSLFQQALEHNFDLKVAAARVKAATIEGTASKY